MHSPLWSSNAMCYISYINDINIAIEVWQYLIGGTVNNLMLTIKSYANKQVDKNNIGNNKSLIYQFVISYVIGNIKLTCNSSESSLTLSRDSHTGTSYTPFCRHKCETNRVLKTICASSDITMIRSYSLGVWSSSNGRNPFSRAYNNTPILQASAYSTQVDTYITEEHRKHTDNHHHYM